MLANVRGFSTSFDGAFADVTEKDSSTLARPRQA